MDIETWEQKQSDANARNKQLKKEIERQKSERQQLNVLINQHTEEAENRSKKGDVETEQKQKITGMAEEAARFFGRCLQPRRGTGSRRSSRRKTPTSSSQDPDKKSRREVSETQVVDQQQNRVQSTVWDTSGVAASNGVTPAFMPLQTVSGAEVKEVGVVIIYC